MNNGVNPNENESLNGQVLGNVGMPENVNNTPVSEPEILDVLDSSVISNNVNNEMNINNQNNINMENVLNQIPNSEALNNVEVTNANINNIGVQNPQPQVTPEPAYTNPQTINPMPGFENSGVIGTTPPVSLEPEKSPKKKGSKVLFIIIIIVLLVGIGFGTFYILKYTDILNNRPKIEITTNHLNLSLGETLQTDINYFAKINGTDPRNCSLNTNDVNINEEGTYEFTISCGEVVKKGKIDVIDNAQLDVIVQKVYKVKNDSVNVEEFITNPNSNYTYEFVSQDEVNNLLVGNPGEYPLKIKVTRGKKEKEVEAKIVIMEYKLKGYLICSTNGQNVGNTNTKKVVEQKFGIFDNANNEFAKISTLTHTFTFTDETEYSNYLATYNIDKKITIDNVTGDATFDNEKLQITMIKELDANELITEYGEEVMKNYASIRAHFETKLGYLCGYKKLGSA